MASSHSSGPGHTNTLTLRPATSGSRMAPTGWRRHHVMVIDDSMAVCRVVEATFSRVGMEATSFPDGMAAINALTSGAVSVPDVVLLDVGLPKMDGYEVARILRSNPGFQETPIIMLTSHDGVVDRVRSRIVGARDFVSKPFKPAELVERVRGHLRLMPEEGETGR